MRAPPALSVLANRRPNRGGSPDAFQKNQESPVHPREVGLDPAKGSTSFSSRRKRSERRLPPIIPNRDRANGKSAAMATLVMRSKAASICPPQRHSLLLLLLLLVHQANISSAMWILEKKKKSSRCNFTAINERAWRISCPSASPTAKTSNPGRVQLLIPRAGGPS